MQLVTISSSDVAAFVLRLVLFMVIFMLWKCFVAVVWTPFHLTRFFRKQGVNGPSNRFVLGSLGEIRSMKMASKAILMDVNSHDTSPRIIPHFLEWFSQYGDIFLFWFGTKPTICIKNVEIVKNVLSNKSDDYTKDTPRPDFWSLVGNKGLLLVEGAEWARHRKVVGQAFTMDKLKLMTKTMAKCTQSMVEIWEDKLRSAKSRTAEIEMSEEFQELTANIISCTAFGSSYTQGKQVFEAQKELHILASETSLSLDFPGYSYLPTKSNLKKWALEKTINTTLTLIIQARLINSAANGDSASHHNDLLGLMINAFQTNPGSNLYPNNNNINIDEIIDECKTFFFAGHETTSLLLTWTMFLLSSRQDWQEKLREEVLRECGDDNIPDAVTIPKLKKMNMVLLESLRLYCPISVLTRKASKRTQLGDVAIPKNTVIKLPVLLIHRDREIWGPDADEFNPLRFENGVSKAAKHPNAFMPFALGPRVCVGQSFAMVEAKTVMAIILGRFSFELSSDYKHAPIDALTLKPQHGLPIVLKSLHA